MDANKRNKKNNLGAYFKPAPRREVAATFFSWLVAVAMASLIFFSGCDKGIKREAEDVIFITIDTLRADHLGAYGYEFIRTPNIDRLAREGATFDQIRVPTPITLPSHTTIFTGLYPPAHGVLDNGNYQVTDRLTTLAEILRTAGYNTGAIIGAFVLDRRFGLNRGFDHYDDSGFQDQGKGKNFFYSERKASEVTDRALVWIKSVLPTKDRADRKTRSKNFFLWAHYYDPHANYNPPPPYDERYHDALYDGEIAYVDEQIGRLLEGVYRLRGRKDLLVVLMSDHGEALGEHGELTHGLFLYDCTVRIPLIFHDPDRIRPRRIPYRAGSVDIAPTVLDLLGIPKPEPMNGSNSLVRMMEGSDKKDRPVYLETAYPHLHYGWSGLRGLVAGGYTVIESPRPEIYADSDLREERDLAALKPLLVQEYLKRLHVMYKQIARPELAKSSRGRMSPTEMRKMVALGYINLTTERKENPNIEPTSGINPADRKFFQVYLSKFITFTADGKYTEAMDMLHKMMETDPQNPYLYLMEAVTYQISNNIENARRSYLKALSLDPNFQNAYSRLGQVEFAEGNIHKAREYYLKAIQLDPADADTYGNLAGAEYSLGNRKEARAMYEKAVEISPSDVEVRVMLGKFLLKEGEMAEARKHLEMALANSPDNLSLLDMVGKTRISTGDRDGAVAAFAHAAELAPQDALAQQNLAAALELGRNGKPLGPGSDLRGAEFYYNRAIELDNSLQFSKDRLRVVRQAMAMGVGQ